MSFCSDWSIEVSLKELETLQLLDPQDVMDAKKREKEVAQRRKDMVARQQQAQQWRWDSLRYTFFN